VCWPCSASSAREEPPVVPGPDPIALAYEREFADEIEAEPETGRREEHELAGRYPFILTFEAAVAGGGA
jgi:hypothetical protein